MYLYSASCLTECEPDKIEAMKTILGRLLHFAFCLDATYPGLQNVLSKREWRTLGYRANKHTQRQIKPIGCSVRSRENGKTVFSSPTADARSNCGGIFGAEDVYTVEEDDAVGAITNPHAERAHASRMSTAQLVISDEFELLHIVCPINGSGEPQYQVVPALMDCMLRAFNSLSKRDAVTDERAITFLLRSDGMNKQKNLGRRTLEELTKAWPELLRAVEHNEATGTTRVVCKSKCGKGHKLQLKVFPLKFIRIFNSF